MRDLCCPYCYHWKFDSEWVYENDLYAVGETKKVECTNCKNSFWVRIIEEITYECTTAEP